MKFGSGLLKVRLTLVQCKTLLNNWDKVAAATCNFSEISLQPISNNCQYSEAVEIVPHFGLCSNVLGSLSKVDTHAMFESFPKWTGSHSYPIEGDADAYTNASNKYVNNDRKALLEHCIELMEQFVEEKSNVN